MLAFIERYIHACYVVGRDDVCMMVSVLVRANDVLITSRRHAIRFFSCSLFYSMSERNFSINSDALRGYIRDSDILHALRWYNELLAWSFNVVRVFGGHCVVKWCKPLRPGFIPDVN